MRNQLLKLVGSGPPSGPERMALRDAISVMTLAKLALEEAKAATARVQAVIDAADDAERDASKAHRAAKELATKWAAEGAPAGAAAQHRAAIAAATQADHLAQEARTEATAAAEAIATLRKAEQDARHKLDQSESRVRTAAANVIFTSAGPLLDRLQRVADQVPEILADVAKLQSLEKLLRELSCDHDRCRSLRSALEKLKAVTSPHADDYPGINFVSAIDRLQRDPDAPVYDFQ